MEKKYDLSIIIPVYNGEKYITDCLNSIYKGFNNSDLCFEVIIVNDGSKDNSYKICSEYKSKYDNIKLFNNSNHGVSYSRNFGISNAVGKFLLFVDCDDMLSENWFNCIDTNNDYDYIYFSNYFINNLEINSTKEKIISYITTYNDDNIRISGPYSKLFNRRFIIDNNIFFKEDIINGEDLLFSLEVTCKANLYSLEKKSFYIVRHNKYSSTSRFNEYLFKSEILFNDNLEKILKKQEYYSDKIRINAFNTSIRAICIRIGNLTNYKLARKYFKIFFENEFYKDNLKKFCFSRNIKKYLFCYLLKLKMFYLIFILGKLYNKRNKFEHFEYL